MQRHVENVSVIDGVGVAAGPRLNCQGVHAFVFVAMQGSEAAVRVDVVRPELGRPADDPLLRPLDAVDRVPVLVPAVERLELGRARRRGGKRTFAFAEMPHADVAVRPDIRRGWRVGRIVASVPRVDRRLRIERRNLDPHRRHAVHVPGVDFVRKKRPVRIEEPQVPAVLLPELRVVEPLDRVREPHQRGEVRQRLAALVSVERDGNPMDELARAQARGRKHQRKGNGGATVHLPSSPRKKCAL